MTDDFKLAQSVAHGTGLDISCPWDRPPDMAPVRRRARARMKRQDRELFEHELMEWIGDSRRKCGVCGEWDLDTCAREC